MEDNEQHSEGPENEVEAEIVFQDARESRTPLGHVEAYADSEEPSGQGREPEVSSAYNRPTSPLYPPVVRVPIQPEDVINSEPPLLPSEVLADSTLHWFFQIVLLLTTWLHLHYHLPHAACNLILRILRFVFITLGALGVDQKVPLTLNTTLKHLGLADEF